VGGIDSRWDSDMKEGTGARCPSCKNEYPLTTVSCPYCKEPLEAARADKALQTAGISLFGALLAPFITPTPLDLIDLMQGLVITFAPVGGGIGACVIALVAWRDIMASGGRIRGGGKAVAALVLGVVAIGVVVWRLAVAIRVGD
jgi:hypothetical protein